MTRSELEPYWYKSPRMGELSVSFFAHVFKVSYRFLFFSHRWAAVEYSSRTHIVAMAIPNASDHRAVVSDRPGESAAIDGSSIYRQNRREHRAHTEDGCCGGDQVENGLSFGSI